MTIGDQSSMLNEVAPALTQVLVLGVPNSRRVCAFTDAVKRIGGVRIDVVSYREVIASTLPAPPPHCLVRIESPSECSETTRAILAAGIEPMEAIRAVPRATHEIDQLTFLRGEMLHPLQWFHGFRQILMRVRDAWSDQDVRWMSHPDAIITTFDKSDCLERWASAGLPVPKRHHGIRSYAQLRRENTDRHARIFIKLRYGYSAMGAVALEWRDDLVRAITTMDVEWANGRPRLFVTKRPRVITREFEIAWLIDTLAMEEIVVEDWLPKARWKSMPYDLRLVMIDGQVCHAVGRASHSPFTNLNLDATRIPQDSIERHLGESWTRCKTLCEQAAAQIPEAGYLGLDVLVRPGGRQYALLEANAFGDYLPGLLYRGQSTYASELSSHWPSAHSPSRRGIV